MPSPLEESLEGSSPSFSVAFRPRPWSLTSITAKLSLDVYKRQVVILAVIVMNAVLGTVQHQKAEKSLESLRALSSPSAKVLRDGQKTEIDARLVVPGDVLLLEAGDLVAADGRVLQGYSLQVNESSLTGESANVDKREGTLAGEVPLAERTNQVFSGLSLIHI